MKSESHMIVDPSHPHALKGGLGHLQGQDVFGSLPAAQKEQYVMGGGKLGGGAKATILRIVDRREGAIAPGKKRRIEWRPREGVLMSLLLHACSPAALPSLQMIHDDVRRAHEALSIVIPHLLDLSDQLHQSRQAHMPFFWYVSGSEEGFFIRSHHNGQWPSPSAADSYGRGHVDLVYVRPLLPIDLDADEGLIQEAGHIGILKGLVGHDMTPVAGGVAHREKDRFILPSGCLECLLSPGVPVHWIAGMLQ